MRAQSLGDTPGLKEFMYSTRVLEINPNHPVILDLDVRIHSIRSFQFFWLLNLFIHSIYSGSLRRQGIIFRMPGRLADLEARKQLSFCMRQR
jgi:hypothetical protein